jgi:putative protease
LPKFNARERSKNFSFEDLETLLSWTRPRSKKVYLALNTLMKEHELPEVVELLAKVADLAPDAVIVQDLGLVKIIRDFMSY